MKRLLILSWCSLAIGCTSAQPQSPTAFRGAHPVAPLGDGNLLVEAEEFRPTGEDGWAAKPWGENYYAATFANSFLSRKAFLGAGEQAEGSATIKVRVPKAGRYLVLVRYEAAYRFETQFRVRVEQKGKRVLDRLYGARENLKIWAFSQKLKTELAWSWGASENIVWEGHDVFANLQAGEATLTLIAAKQPEPSAKRNVDCLLLTTDEAQVKMRIEKEKYLPLDGMLTQSGDVFLKVTNLGDSELTFTGKGAPGGGNWQQHSPYWVHLRNWPTVNVKVATGKSSEWMEVGGTMDTLNDGQWNFSGNGKYRAEFALKESDGKLTPIAKFEGDGDLLLAGDADTRYSRRLRRREEVLYDLLAELKKEPLRGRIPTEMQIYGYTFTPGFGPKYDAAVTEFREMFGLRDTSLKNGTYIDVRGVPTPKLAEYCKNLGARAKRIRCVSLGDEIGLPKPSGKTVTVDFIAWLKSRGLKAQDVVPSAKDWTAIAFNSSDALKAKQPGVFYWSRRYRNHYGIQAIKQRTDILRRHLPNAGIGANFSPHYPTEHRYLGEVHKWVTIFREEGMTMPWSEDYIFQMPVATQQMNNINLDLLRAGVRGKPNMKIHYYCMPHWPGQIPDNWRRLFYGALGHGMQVVNLFEFRPVQVAYTENHCSNPETYRTILRSFRELGQFEDIIQSGRNRPAKAALWFSETADIWGDNHGSFAAGKRTLYTMILHRSHQLDFVIEGDALKDYQQLYLTDRHVSRAASRAIVEWVNAGGQLIATAGAGMFDELNRPNTTLRELFGIKKITLIAPEGKAIEMVKQDLPFAEPIDSFEYANLLGRHIVNLPNEKPRKTMPVFSVRCKIELTDQSDVRMNFKDGSPAIFKHQPKGGKGEVLYSAYLPGLSYFHPAIPRIPVDRGTHAKASAHLIPPYSKVNHDANFLSIGDILENEVICLRDNVEASVIDSPKGSVIILTNWGGRPSKELVVMLPKHLKDKKMTRASGKPFQRNGGRIVLDLNVADALILR